LIARLQFSRLLFGVLLFIVPLPQALALLNIDGTRNQVFVFGSLSFGYSSNIFSESSGRGDYSSTASAGVEMKRRAGIIAVNGTFKIDYQQFLEFTGENGLNPSLAIEFNKTTGRTTGAITINAYRESRSDSAVNLRTNTWNFPLGLNIKYPINDKFYATSSTGYLKRSYSNTTVLSNYTDITESVDLFYVYTSKLDLIGGYRIRYAQTSTNGTTYDHWFNVGATGGLLAKLTGTIRIGYQLRQLPRNETFDHINALAELGWALSRKFTLKGQISRDFNTIATGATVDSSGAALRANYVFNRKAEIDGGVGYGRNVFLGRNQPARRDDSFNWDVGAKYKFNEHLNLGASYNYMKNWSTLSFSDFERTGINFDISSRF
jgi:Putative beta-barrel porin 2